jgi:DNA-binding NarL/FixJ family response regulator
MGKSTQSDPVERLLAEVSEKLDVLTKVVAIQVASDKSTTERARLLKLAGLDNQTIADVLNTSPATISVLTSNLRTKRRAP